jgi:hypothetical protein
MPVVKLCLLDILSLIIIGPSKCYKLVDYVLHCRELGQTKEQLAEAARQLEAVGAAAADVDRVAAERQKKFALLNATFRKKEEALQARADEAEALAQQLQAEASMVAEESRAAKQVEFSVHSPEAPLHMSGSKVAPHVLLLTWYFACFIHGGIVLCQS